MKRMIALYDAFGLSHKVIPWSDADGMQRIWDEVTQTTYVFDKDGAYLSRNIGNGEIVQVFRGEELDTVRVIRMARALIDRPNY